MKYADEVKRCAEDFVYFCKTYIKIYSYARNEETKTSQKKILFELYPYQERLFRHWEINCYSIGSKFRVGGFTTLAVVYGLWKCLFQLDQKIVYVAYCVYAAGEAGKIIKQVIGDLPDWLKGNISRMTNDHEKRFEDTNSSMSFMVPEFVGTFNLLIIDEATKINNLEDLWIKWWPHLARSGSVIIQSTVDRTDDWFWETLIDAKIGYNKFFKEFVCSYKEKPEYSLPNWEQDMRRSLGPKNWQISMEQVPYRQEVIPVEINKPKKKDRWRSLFDD